MKKFIVLASAALIFSACDEDSTSASGVNLGTKFLSAKNVTVDEANQTIDITLPQCVRQNGKAVLQETASGPSPYTIEGGRLIIEDNAFPAKGNNKSIIGVWELDANEMLGEDSEMDFSQIGFKAYLDIGKHNFDMYVNSDNVCMAKLFADAMVGDPDAEDMTIISQECNKIVISSEGIKMTIATEPNFPNVSISLSVMNFTCEMKVTMEQANANNCTDDNLLDGNFAGEGLLYQKEESSSGCALMGLSKANRLAKKVVKRLR